MAWLRHPRTTAELRAGFTRRTLRHKAQFLAIIAGEFPVSFGYRLPSAYDDKIIRAPRSWKHWRRAQYRQKEMS